MACIERSASKVKPLPEAKTTNFINIILPALLIFVFANFDIAQAAVPPARSLIKQILTLQHSASDLVTWHEQEHLISAARAELMSDTYTEKDRCHELKNLNDENLLSFYDSVTDTALISRIAACRPELAERINQYFAMKSNSLDLSFKKIAAEKLSQCSPRKSETFGPEVDYIVDPKEGGILFGDHHPKCTITFTFDDGPHPTLTPKLLTTLKNENLLVNFFVVGNRVKSSPGILKDQYAAGHLIGNHSMTHADLRKLSFEDATAEIENGFDTITKVIGDYLPFFRFPYGAHTKTLQAYLNHFSRVEFYWNVDTTDWKIKDPELLYSYALEQIELTKGGIVLMHDIQPQTIIVVPYLLEALRSAGYTPYLIRPTENLKKINVP